MITIKEMKNCIGKNIIINFTDGQKLSTYCEEYVAKVEGEDEEPVLFISNSMFVRQSEIQSIEIL